jgi:hypothetical protein
MTTKEAIHAMLDGKKVYRESWKNDYVDYFYFDGECFRDEQDVLLMCDFHGADWEIYEEPKPKQTVTIEKWLCQSGFSDALCIIEANKEYFEAYAKEKVKLLSTQEVEL